ncbi:hypothetical protein IVG45_21065 [Methylomonas sp. LL1]|nr:hypothetical protein [Methylomonas sp. LL1]QPK63264.1 hypothetical protein IVG45_21065 [Methylomonas sp. LL1]
MMMTGDIDITTIITIIDMATTRIIDPICRQQWDIIQRQSGIMGRRR